MTSDGKFTDPFRTGSAPLTGRVFYTVSMPKTLWFIAQVADALRSLTLEENWELGGTVTVEETINEAYELFRNFKPMVGVIMPCVMAVIPSNWLLCDGSTYLREDYPNLYAVLDPVFIVDADSFTVPDLRGRTVIGANGAFPVNIDGGEIEHTLTEAEMPSHSHTYVPPTINVDVEAPGVPDPVAAGLGLPTQTGSAGGNQAHNNMQPYLPLRYVIWAR